MSRPIGRHLDGLPAEILCLICSQLCTHCLESHSGRTHPHHDPAERVEVRLRRSGLASLCRVSTVLHAVATPYLYHFVFHQWPEDKGKTLPSLLETVTRRPDLANLVKHIEVDHTTVFALPVNLIGDISGIAANRNLNLLPGWSDDSHRGALAFIELLLLQTPNVETLHLLVDETRTTFSDLSESFSLPALTTLTAAAHPRVPSDWEEPFHFGCGFLLRFLRGSPHITHLGLHRAQNLLPFHVAIREHETLLAVAPFASITSLTLSHSRHIRFERVIEACDRLEVFKMTFGNKFDPLYRCFHDVLRGLQKHKSSLHTFVFAGGIYLNVPEVDERPTFREFTSLHSILIVPYISYLTGAFESIVDFLPSSVRRLRLLDVEGADAREGLWGLHAALRRGEFQHLEELVVNPGTPRADPIGRDQEYGWDDPGVAMAALGMAFWELEGLLFLLRDVDGTVDGLVDAEAVSGRCLGT